MKPTLEGILTEKWYTQGAPGRPFYMIAFVRADSSTDYMHKDLGFSYQQYFFLFKNDYFEGSYFAAELELNAQRILSELRKDPLFFKKKKTRYEQEVKWFFSIVQKKLSGLPAFSDSELIDFLHWTAIHINCVIGISHLIESVSFRIEHDLRHAVKHKVPSQDVNSLFVRLTMATKPSLALKKDELLWKIKKAPLKIRRRLIQKFIETFGWVDGGYAGPKEWNAEEVLKAANSISFVEPLDFDKIQKDKKEACKQVGLSKTELDWVEWIDFLTLWQDERKRNILRGVLVMDALANELSRRFSVPKEALAHMLPLEITLGNLKDKSLEKTAALRKKGFVYLSTLNGFFLFEGKNVLEFDSKFHGKHDELESIHGQCASMGNATGKVFVLKTLDSIGKIEEGAVLVASMTRPEFVPAMRKAAAIVTDEGGITSHAAIVSRELGKPCVIGTKVATKILKDGWIVQVKANHGQVIVLEKTK